MLVSGLSLASFHVIILVDNVTDLEVSAEPDATAIEYGLLT
jgi:hypothetical protein